MKSKNKTYDIKLILSGIIPFLFIVALIAYVFGPGSEILEVGTSLPELTIEKVSFLDSEIQVLVRNTGPMPVEVAMADVNDRIQPSAIEPDRFLNRYETALVRIPFEWNEAEPYLIGITTNDGTRFEKEIKSAVFAFEPNSKMIEFFAIVGTYVGIIPVMIGILWLPFLRRLKKSQYQFFLALTAGLLLFLGIDALEEALEISAENLAKSFNGTLLVATALIVSFLGLYYVGQRFGKTDSMGIAKPMAVALMVSVGIGLHNFGEGLAIGAAVGLGSLAFSTFLIVGFALHNTTEGIAIAAPLSKERRVIAKLALLGIIAGAPAIFGGWVGGFVYSPFASVLFLAIGAGAIFQVILVIVQWLREDDRTLSSASTVSGFATGLLIMYVTSILI